MNSVDNKYKSELGWSITLPAGWEPLSSAANVALANIALAPVAFAAASDSSLSMTWMALEPAVDADVLSKFTSLTMLEGTAPLEETLDVVQRLWPAIGDITEARIVELADSTTALEVVENFYQPGTQEIKKGYQLIFYASLEDGGSPVMQRLCFYAPMNKFIASIEQVQAAARSFQLD